MVAIGVVTVHQTHIHLCPIREAQHPLLRIGMPDGELTVGGLGVKQETAIGREPGEGGAQAIRPDQGVYRQLDRSLLGIESHPTEVVADLLVIGRHLHRRCATEIEPLAIGREGGEGLVVALRDQ